MAFRRSVDNGEGSGDVSPLVYSASVGTGKNSSRGIKQENIVRYFSIAAGRLIGGKHYVSYHYPPVVPCSAHTYVWPPVDVDRVKYSIGEDEASNRPSRGKVLSRDIAGVVDSERDRETGSRVINLRELPVTKQETVSPSASPNAPTMSPLAFMARAAASPG